MKNIVLKDDRTIIKKNLMEKYKETIKTIPSDINQYLIEPEFNEFNEIQRRINNNMLIELEQFSLFDDTITYEKPYEIIEIHPPFNDYCNDFSMFFDIYEEFEKNNS